MPSTNSTNSVETVVIDSPSLQMLCSHSHIGPILFVVCDSAVWLDVTGPYISDSMVLSM